MAMRPIAFCCALVVVASAAAFAGQSSTVKTVPHETLRGFLPDSSLNQMLTSAFLMGAKAGVVEKTADGYTKGTTVAGFPAVESWTPAAKNGELGLLVGGRYLVKVNGSTVPDVETIRKAVEAIDLKKLAALK